MKTVYIYESAYSDGYSHFGDAEFFLTEDEADKYSHDRHDGYSVKSKRYAAIKTEDGRYYLLVGDKPVSLFGSNQKKEDLAAKIISKLTEEEKEALEKYYGYF